MRIFIAGGTGLIGTRLTEQLLARGDQVRVLSRGSAKARRILGERVEVIEGDPTVAGSWMKGIDGCDAVVNLAGEPIADKAWSEEQRQKLRSSRVDVTRHLVEGIRAAAQRPRILVNGSAVGVYGDRGEEKLDESATMADDFVGRLVREWEQEAQPAEALGVRVVCLRTGIVLDPRGGALAKMVLPFKLFAGGPLGSGNQWFPWIHHADIVGLLRFSLDNDRAQGPLNGAAPEIVTMRQFSDALGRVLKRPSWLSVPKFALKIGMGERADLLLASQRVIPRKALELGYSFRFPQLEPALRDVLKD